ncbi:MAG: aspartate-semialdehyde dehydrogenase [Chlamydiota bacterium]
MKIPIGILGATGIVGQKYINRLANHPLFEIVYLAASERSSGKTYEEAVLGRWHQDNPIPEKIAPLLVYPLAENCQAIRRCRLLFSALDNESAIIFEPHFANIGFPIVSNASWGRKEADIPVIIPEINSDHLSILPIQQKNRSWKGFIVAKPCCTVQSYLIALGILHKEFGLEKVFITSFQALSGAGWPGVAAIDILDNVIPFVRGEEEKCEEEPLKILGSIGSSSIIKNSQIRISAHCNRVPVLDGHLTCVSFSLKDKRATKQDILNTWERAPKGLIHYTESEDRPQPRKDKDRGLGMTVSVGRLRTCPLLDFRLVALSHNTVRGAAGGGVLTAELLVSKGLI